MTLIALTAAPFDRCVARLTNCRLQLQFVRREHDPKHCPGTYLELADTTVVGFYTLVVGEVAYTDAPERLTKGLAQHPVPLMLLARMGVGTDWKGRGVGAGDSWGEDSVSIPSA